jgi:hypothetical protein
MFTFTLWKESLNIDGQHFHQYHKNEHSPATFERRQNHLLEKVMFDITICKYIQKFIKLKHVDSTYWGYAKKRRTFLTETRW